MFENAPFKAVGEDWVSGVFWWQIFKVWPTEQDRVAVTHLMGMTDLAWEKVELAIVARPTCHHPFPALKLWINDLNLLYGLESSSHEGLGGVAGMPTTPWTP